MWILERADARDATGVLSCPDSDATGVPMQWQISLRPDVVVRCDEDVVHATQRGGDTEDTLERAGGDQLVVIGRVGQTQVSDVRGSWVRTLGPDDALVLEGDDPEAVRCEPEADASWCAVQLRAVTATPLRWIP